MFQGAKVVKQEGMPCDSEMLIRYFTETLGGNVTAEQYGTLTGEGRIKVLAADSEEAHRYEETGRTEPTGEKEGKVTYVCSLCGKEKTEVLEKLPVSGSGTHTGGVDTGDNFPAARLAVALVGGAALDRGAYCGTKRNTQRDNRIQTGGGVFKPACFGLRAVGPAHGAACSFKIEKNSSEQQNVRNLTHIRKNHTVCADQGREEGMQMRKKWRWIFALLAVLVLLAAGCSSRDGSGAGSKASTQAAGGRNR